MFDLFFGDLLISVEYLQNWVAVASAYIKDLVSSSLKLLYCLNVCIRQIDDMDIVSDARPIPSLIVPAEYVQLLTTLH